MDRYFNQLIFGNPLTLNDPLSEEEIRVLNRYKAANHKKYSRKAFALLMVNEGNTLADVMEATHVTERTIYRWLSNFNRDRLESIKVRINAPDREHRKAERQARIIGIVHTMPSLYGINRTTWTYATIAQAHNIVYGIPISKYMIPEAIRNTGYRWRHARMVLTSPDPDYRIKVERILDALHALKEGERFFFVDEVGPYRVKKYGGMVLRPEGEIETIPEHQKIRGKVQFVAALEAVTNQMTWLFTADKTAFSLIALIERLTQDYATCPAIFLTWDAMSVHASKAVMDWISAHNDGGKGPEVKVVPLPSKSQFLNVIEAVFGGMKKAVICNSDYASPREMQTAIAGYFEERNQYFRDNPKRAGDKIWDKQSFDIDRLASGLFKKM